ncbi:MAG: lactate utilization protein C [Armatimonadota bacterium]
MERNRFIAQLRSRMPTTTRKPVYVDDRVQRRLSPDACLALFLERATAALSHVHVCESIEKAASIIDSIIANESYVDTGCRRFARVLDSLSVRSERSLASDRDVTFGISEARFGVALTGTCVIDSTQHRGGTLLPPRHIILIDASDIVEDLHAAYARVAESLQVNRTSVFAFHTGPSRSADIEQTMALGVHGPGNVHIVVFAIPSLQ